MKILCFIESLASGGAEKSAVRLVDEWVDQGHEVHLALVQDVQTYRPSRSGVRVYALDGSRGAYLRALTSAFQVARQVQPDVVLGHMPKGVLLAMAAQLANPAAKLIAVEHSIPEHHYQGLKKWLVRCLVARGYRRADAVIAVSSGGADNLLAWGAPLQKLHALGNPIPVKGLYQAAKDGCSLRRRPELPGIAAVGRLVPLKGFDVLVRAIAALKDSGFPVEAVILGEGPEREHLASLVAHLEVGDLVSFPGHVDHPEATVMDAQLLVCASYYEGFGNVLVEAMAVGTGAVSTDCPTGPREILKDPARLALPGDPDSLARVIREQLEHYQHLAPKARADLKKALRAEAAARFDAPGVARRYLATVVA